MPANNGYEEDLPTFLKWECPVRNETHIFMRSDWVMDFLFRHLPKEDALRTWSKMHVQKVLAEQGEEAAKEFLDALGPLEH